MTLAGKGVTGLWVCKCIRKEAGCQANSPISEIHKKSSQTDQWLDLRSKQRKTNNNGEIKRTRRPELITIRILSQLVVLFSNTTRATKPRWYWSRKEPVIISWGSLCDTEHGEAHQPSLFPGNGRPGLAAFHALQVHLAQRLLLPDERLQHRHDVCCGLHWGVEKSARF